MPPKERDSAEKYSDTRTPPLPPDIAPLRSPSLHRAQQATSTSSPVQDAPPTINPKPRTRSFTARSWKGLAIVLAFILLANLVITTLFFAVKGNWFANLNAHSSASAISPTATILPVNATAATATYIARQAFSEAQPGCGSDTKLHFPSEDSINCIQNLSYSLVTFRPNNQGDLVLATYSPPQSAEAYGFDMSIDLDQWKTPTTEIFIGLTWISPSAGGLESLGLTSMSSGKWNVTNYGLYSFNGMTTPHVVQHLVFHYAVAADNETLTVTLNGESTTFMFSNLLPPSLQSFAIDVDDRENNNPTQGSTAALANFTFKPAP